MPPKKSRRAKEEEIEATEAAAEASRAASPAKDKKKSKRGTDDEPPASPERKKSRQSAVKVEEVEEAPAKKLRRAKDGKESKDADAEAAPEAAPDAETAIAKVDAVPDIIINPEAYIPKQKGADYCQPGQKRLVIHKITMHNFKSYGGERIIGPFHTQFSSIVGPNGSGKSNTIDALLFVFGKRAKKIRLNKVSELIHNSKGNENLESAKVIVHFIEIIDGEDGNSTKVPDSDIFVAREAKRDNSSKYQMQVGPDGPKNRLKGSNFQEVQTLLKGKGIDLEHNRFLILQGEVEQISLMKPKAATEHEEGLLEYLEDLIGSNRWAEPAERAAKVLEEASEQRQEKLGRMRAAEKEKDALEGPRREAEEYVRAEAQHLEQRARLAQLQRAAGLEEHAAAKAKLEAAQAKIEEVRKIVKEEEKAVKVLDKEMKQKADVAEKVREEMELAKNQFRELEAKDAALVEEIKGEEAAKQKAELAVKAEANRAKREEERAAELEKYIPAGEETITAATEEVGLMQKELEEEEQKLRGVTAGLGKEKDGLEKKLTKVKHSLNEKKQAAEVAEAEAKAITSNHDNAVLQRQQLEGMLQHAEQRQQGAAEEVENQKTSRKELQDAIQQANGQMVSFGKEVETLEAQLQQAKAAFREAQQSLAAGANRSQLVKQVMMAVRNGDLKGVHGRLGDLGTIDKKYDVAISTACGALDHLVVDTTEDAQAAVEFVREKGLGRTTFIIMDKIRAKKLPPNDAPEGLPRLVDLVQAPAGFANAFAFALGDTLVAQDLDQATRVGLQGNRRRRVVSLDGKLIDSSGTMSGGGGPAKGGGMKNIQSGATEEDVRNLQEKVEDLMAKVSVRKQNQMKQEQEVRKREKDMSDFEVKVQKAIIELRDLDLNRAQYKKRLEQMPKAELSAAEKKQLAAAEKTLSAMRLEEDKVRSEASVFEERIAVLHEQITNAGGEKLQAMKANVAKAKKERDDIERKVKKMKIDAEQARKNAKQATAKAEKAQATLASTDDVVKQLNEKREGIMDKADEVMKVFQSIRDEVLVEKQAELKELEKVRDAKAAVAKKAKDQEVDAMAQAEECTKVLKNSESKAAEYGKMLLAVRKEYLALPMDLLSEEAQNELVGDAAMAIQGDLSPEQLAQLNPRDIEARMLTLEGNLAQLKPNLSVISDYKAKLEEWERKNADFDECNARRDEARKQLDDLRKKRLDEFMAGFNIIAMKLKEMYQMITLGGDAELELVDTLDPFSEGIHFSVRPPKKSWKQIQNLSGGEKTLSSLALVFALHHYRPTPLYFMDEIDAALDFRNVSIIANYIKDRTKNAQFIVISLRNHMFELADRLVGIYKTHDISKSVAISTSHFALQDASSKVNREALEKSAAAPPGSPAAVAAH